VRLPPLPPTLFSGLDITEVLASHGPLEHCYRPIIVRNTPLPVSRTESYMTMVDHQEACEVCVYQGDDPYALNDPYVLNKWR
jgi:molecular chaperone HscC